MVDVYSFKQHFVSKGVDIFCSRQRFKHGNFISSEDGKGKPGLKVRVACYKKVE